MLYSDSVIFHTEEELQAFLTGVLEKSLLGYLRFACKCNRRDELELTAATVHVEGQSER